MFTPHQYGIIRLSERDINSIRWLYSLPYGTSVKTLNEAYGFSYANIDDAIMHSATGNVESEFERTMKNTHIERRDLEEEQAKLAQIRKFQMSIQNIRLPKEIADKFKEM
jgi:hypothetical protein